MRKTTFVNFSGVMVWLLAVAPAQASFSLAEQMRECSKISNALERLVCFDELAATLPSTATPAVPTPAAPRAPQAAEQQPTAAQVAAAEQRAREAEERLAALQAAEAEAAAAAEQAKRLQPPTEKTYYEVLEVWQSPRGLQRFRLDNGVAWEQTTSGDRLVVQPGERYFIQPGRFGGFSLGSDNFNRRMRVQPIE